jgi:hypothetical protein
MQNTIYIDINTERERKVLIGKGPESEQPKTPEDAKDMVVIDIATICEGLCELIHVADQNGYGSKKDFVRVSIEKLNALLVD